MAVWAGASLGPLVGGIVSDTWGYRAAFFVTGALLFIAGLIVWRMVHEEFTPLPRDKAKASSGFWYGLRLVLRDRNLVSLFSIRTLLQLAVVTLSPVLALFVQSLVPPGTRVASLTGLISGVQAATSAAGAVTLGRAGDRLGYRRVLLTCAVAGSLLYVPQFFVANPWQLLVLQGAVGLVMSGVLASISALQAHLSPEGHQGAVYGVDASATSVANAIGPMLGATVAATLGLRAPFLLAAGGIALAAALAWRLIPKPEH
jgi:DHA1 family multidrug resistance protein-like MFS transporter